jgi:hypothetical protein
VLYPYLQVFNGISVTIIRWHSCRLRHPNAFKGERHGVAKGVWAVVVDSSVDGFSSALKVSEYGFNSVYHASFRSTGGGQAGPP